MQHFSGCTAAMYIALSLCLDRPWTEGPKSDFSFPTSRDYFFSVVLHSLRAVLVYAESSPSKPLPFFCHGAYKY